MDSLNEVHPSLTGRVLVIQLLDWIFRGVAQVMFVNNPLSGLLITTGLFLQEPWWALNSLLGTVVSTVSAVLLGQNRSDGISPLLLLLHQRIKKKNTKKKHSPPATKPLSPSLPLSVPGGNYFFSFHTVLFSRCVFLLIVFLTHVDNICHIHLREAVSAGLYGYNGTLVGMLMAVFSTKGSWYWWLLLPNVFMSMLWWVFSQKFIRFVWSRTLGNCTLTTTAYETGNETKAFSENRETFKLIQGDCSPPQGYADVMW